MTLTAVASVAAQIMDHAPQSAKPAPRCPYRPAEFQVVIEIDPIEEVTKGGIILPTQMTEREELATEEGTLVAVSPLAFGYAKPEEWGDHPKPQVGERVMIRRYDGLLRKRVMDGVERTFRIVPDKSVVAVIEEDA